jgi:tetratricopeptide (TPR) repeat protein
VVEKLPLLVLAALSCGMTLWTHSSVRSTNPVERLSLATRLANGLVSYAVYLGQSFFPSDLAPFYPHPGVRLSTAAVGGALLLLLAITAIAAYGWRRLPYVLVGWLWFLGMLVPVIGLMQICAHARADRYTYLSQIGLSIALAWGVWSIYRARQAIAAAPWRRWTLAAVSVGTVLALAAMAWRQTTYWRNAETLWTHTLACTEQNVLAHYNLGYTYAMQGNTAEAISQLRDAVAGQSIEPIVIAKSHGLLADSLTKQGEFDEALAHYEQAVRIYAEGAIFHDRLAQALARRNNHERAVVEFREVVRLAPNYWQARVGLAASLLARGETREAIVQCREALDHDPTAVKASVILGEALATEGQPEEALAPLRRALDLQPDNAQAHFHLGLVLGELGRSRPAIDHLDEAVRLRPDDVAMLGQMAWLLATSPNASMRDGARAVELANRAVKLSGGQQPHPFDALAAALAEAGQFPAAIAAAEQAATLAEARGDEALVGAIQQRTRLYRQDLPYRQPTSSASGNPARLRIK